MLSPRAKHGDHPRSVSNRSRTNRQQKTREGSVAQSSSPRLVGQEQRGNETSSSRQSPRSGPANHTKTKPRPSSSRSTSNNRKTKTSPRGNTAAKTQSPRTLQDKLAVPRQSNSSPRSARTRSNLLPYMYTRECGLPPDLQDLDTLISSIPRDSKTEEKPPAKTKMSPMSPRHLLSPRRQDLESLTCPNPGDSKTEERAQAKNKISPRHLVSPRLQDLESLTSPNPGDSKNEKTPPAQTKILSLNLQDLESQTSPNLRDSKNQEKPQTQTKTSPRHLASLNLQDLEPLTGPNPRDSKDEEKSPAKSKISPRHILSPSLQDLESLTCTKPRDSNPPARPKMSPRHLTSLNLQDLESPTYTNPRDSNVEEKPPTKSKMSGSPRLVLSPSLQDFESLSCPNPRDNSEEKAPAKNKMSPRHIFLPSIEDLESLSFTNPRDNKSEEKSPAKNKTSPRHRHASPLREKSGQTFQQESSSFSSSHKENSFKNALLSPGPFGSYYTINDVDSVLKGVLSQRRRYPYCEACCDDSIALFFTDSLACLQHRKERREHREQPWTEDTPEYEDLQWKIVNELQLNIDTYKGDILDLRWKAEQMQERADLAAHGALPPPRVVLISSTVPKAKFLPLTVKNEPDILVVSYDHQNDGFEKILGAVQTRMNSYCPGCKAKSLLLYIQGGPAHLYLKKNKVTTVAKLKKAEGEDMVWFWKTLGCMMSKVDSKTTVIHIMGCNVMGFPKYVGIDLFEYLQELMKPSIVRFEAPLETSKKGKAVIESYFDANKYKLWKSQRYSILDRVFGL
ncbi:hypothetical protein Bbelb_041240 [Branchiostoma belcheri]|nr:hypothetical protein Bbelb_041240 [Branchiostoma belcheri]